MQMMIKTTITIPEDLLQMAKIKAVQEKTNLSALIRKGLLKQIDAPEVSKRATSIQSFFNTLPSNQMPVSKHSSHLDAMFADQWNQKS